MKVLVADTDWHFTRQISAYLESHAHLVISQPDPREALDCVKSWKPDLVVLGAELGEKDLLNKINSFSPRPAVLLTEHMDRYDRAWRVWQKGGDELLMKPVFNDEEIHQAVVTAMENAATGTIVRPAAATA